MSTEECDMKQQQGTQQNFRSIFPPPHIRSIFPPPHMHPWLMFMHGKSKRNQTFCSLSENCLYVKSIPNMRRKIYFGSYFGWMILLDECSDDCFLLNPVSLKKIELPPWGDFTTKRCLLSSPPDDTTCIVLFAEKVGYGRASFRFCKPGDTDWSYEDIHIGMDECVYDIIICKGQIYALVESPARRKLVILDIGKDDTIVMESEAIPMVPYGEMDFYRKECVEVEGIGDRAFFIGLSCWTSCPSKESGNTIYFTMDQDRSLYAFHLKEKNLIVTLPCSNVIDN